MGRLLLGDCLDKLKTLTDNSVDSIVTDPPYGISFMGKKWDYDVPSVDIWKECLRVLKPGGHLLAFGGTRTYHRLVVAIEDAGFEIRDQIQWLYGQGFPKSQDISKFIDKEFECQSSFNVNLADVTSARTLLELRAEKTGSVLGHVAIPREDAVGKLMVIGEVVDSSGQTVTFQCESEEETSLSTDTLWSSTSDDPSNPGKKYITETKLKAITGSKILSLLPKLNTRVSTCGTGTALKPANEPICLARKPLSEKTVAANVLKHGTGGLNIDGTRVGTDLVEQGRAGRSTEKSGSVALEGGDLKATEGSFAIGRFPANVILDEDAAKVLDEQTGDLGPSRGGRIGKKAQANVTNVPAGHFEKGDPGFGDSGGASRFFYVAKASKSDRNSGLPKGFHTWENLDQSLVDRVAKLSAHLKVMLGDSMPAQGDLEWITFLSGKQQTDLSPKDTISITSMESKTITVSTTLNALANLNTRESIQDVIEMLKGPGSNPAESAEAISLLLQSTTSVWTVSLLGAVRAVLQTLSPIRKLEGNAHSTVKPIKLMEYLCKLITPPGGIVLDPFMGSGTTGVAAVRNGFDFIGVEREPAYFDISKNRILAAKAESEKESA